MRSCVEDMVHSGSPRRVFRVSLCKRLHHTRRACFKASEAERRLDNCSDDIWSGLSERRWMGTRFCSKLSARNTNG